ncbi:MAG: trypsin-like peptidase domain-containing protein [Sphaerochaetaceae bacterium]|nr:trypsin-like peptidase domain-containing protein [Spirochaetales bacterium]MDY5499429.1 trypsin-like peptidase domain-containing protein [Sphaerochaetaceae bacterium]
MKRKTDLMRLFTLFVVILLAVLVGALLVGWTRSIGRNRQREQLKKTLKTIVREDGERALFDLADLPVKEILYGDEGLTVLSGDDESWRYSYDEVQNMRIYDKVGPSVVAISSSMPLAGGNHKQERGSGFVLSDNGYLMTNAHVVEGADSITVSLSDESTIAATIVGISSIDDLAVLRIDTNEKMTAVSLGESQELRVGQKVLAIGNPFGYDRTLSVGVVSGLGRSVKTETGKVIMNAIQSDTAVNPGSSGGPLINGQGEVVGIISSIFSTTGTSQGISFAIPIDTAISLLPDLLKYGTVRRGWIDIVPVQLTKAIASYGHMDIDEGILVSQVVSGGNAEVAGLKGGTEAVKYGDDVIYLGGDVITEIAGTPVRRLSDLYMALLGTREGDTVQVTVHRGGQDRKIPVTLVFRQSDDVSNLVH